MFGTSFGVFINISLLIEHEVFFNGMKIIQKMDDALLHHFMLALEADAMADGEVVYKPVE